MNLNYLSKTNIWENLQKKEIERYNWTIDYVRDEMFNGRDLWSSLGSAGLTFLTDIKRFTSYASQQGALDITEPILEEHPEWC